MAYDPSGTEKERNHIVNSTKDFLQQWEKFAPTNLKHNLVLEAVNYFGSYLNIDNAQIDLLRTEIYPNIV